MLVMHALRDGGLLFDEAAARRQLEANFAAAAPYAAELTDKLAMFIHEDDDVSRVFLDAVPTMTAFAFSVMDSASQLIGANEQHVRTSRHALAAYVIGSSIFDHAVDDDRGLLAEIAEDLTEESLRQALDGQNGEIPRHARSGLARAFWWLVRQFVTTVDGITDRRRRTVIDVRRQLTSVLLEAYRGANHDTRGIREDAWTSPLFVAYVILRLSGAIHATPDPTLEQVVRRTGTLFLRIDDVTDIEDDWTGSSANALLDAVREPHDAALPWNRLFSHPALESQLKEIRELAMSLAQLPIAPAIGAWVYYWLYS